MQCDTHTLTVRRRAAPALIGASSSEGIIMFCVAIYQQRGWKKKKRKKTLTCCVNMLQLIWAAWWIAGVRCYHGDDYLNASEAVEAFGGDFWPTYQMLGRPFIPDIQVVPGREDFVCAFVCGGQGEITLHVNQSTSLLLITNLWPRVCSPPACWPHCHGTFG